MGYGVRQALPGDLDIVVELRFALLVEHSANPIYSRLRPDARERARGVYGTQLGSDREIMFLAHELAAGPAVGVLRCVESLGSPLFYPERYGYVSSAYVRPAHRRRGVLRLMLASAEQWCVERGLTEIRLHNASENRDAAAAWATLGFGAVEELRLRLLHEDSGVPGG